MTKKRPRASLSNKEQADVSQVDKSDLHGVKFQKDNFSRKYLTISNELNGNNFEQISNSFHTSNMQPPKVSTLINRYIDLMSLVFISKINYAFNYVIVT